MATKIPDAFSEQNGGPALDQLVSRIKASTERPHVSIIRVCRRPIKDEDNLYSSVRYILNAIKYSRLILDDSRKAISLEITQEIAARGQEYGTRIKIEYP
jgi:hypothetical protein